MPAKSPEDEEKWSKAKKIAKKSGRKDDYAYIMGIYKKMKPDYFKEIEMRRLIEELNMIAELDNSKAKRSKKSKVDAAPKSGKEEAAEMMDGVRDDLETAITSTRRFVRNIEKLEMAADDIGKASKELRGGEGRTDVPSGVKSALRKWAKVMSSLYGDFAEGRTAMYAVAKAAGISTRRAGKLKGKSVPAGEMDRGDMVSDIERYAGRLGKQIIRSADNGSRALRVGDKLLKQKSFKDKDAAIDKINAFVQAWLDFRDSSGGAFFAAIKGIEKRAKEIGARLELPKLRSALESMASDARNLLSEDEFIGGLFWELDEGFDDSLEESFDDSFDEKKNSIAESLLGEELSSLLGLTESERFDVENGGHFRMKSVDLAGVLRNSGVKPGADLGLYLRGEAPIPERLMQNIIDADPSIERKGRGLRRFFQAAKVKQMAKRSKRMGPRPVGPREASNRLDKAVWKHGYELGVEWTAGKIYDAIVSGESKDDTWGEIEGTLYDLGQVLLSDGGVTAMKRGQARYSIIDLARIAGVSPSILDQMGTDAAAQGFHDSFDKEWEKQMKRHASRVQPVIRRGARAG